MSLLSKFGWVSPPQTKILATPLLYTEIFYCCKHSMSLYTYTRILYREVVFFFEFAEINNLTVFSLAFTWS